MRAGAWLPEAILAACVAVAGVLCTALVFQWMRAWEVEIVHLDFRSRAEATASVIERQLNGAHGDLQLLGDLFDQRNGEVSREEFHLFTASLLKRAPFVQGFALHRMVLDKDREAFEQERRRSMPGYQIRQLENDTHQVAGRRPIYRVIDYIEPFEQFKGAFGLDGQTLPVTVDAASIAERTGEPAITAFMTLPFIKVRGFLIFMPLYYTGDMPAGWKRDNAYAYAVAIFSVQDSMSRILAMPEVSPQFELKLFGGDEYGVWHPAFATPRFQRPRPASVPLLSRLYDERDLYFEKDFSLLQSSWRLSMSAPRPSLWEEHVGSMLSLLVGLVMTGSLSVYTWAVRSGKRRVAALVAQRTLELNDANARLRQDVSRREAHNRILHLMASGAKLVLLMDEIVLFIQNQLGGRYRCLVLLNDATVRAPSLPQDLIAALVDDTDLRARATQAALRWRAGMPDFSASFHRVLARQNLHSLASRPILDKARNQLGALLILGSEPQWPDPPEEELLAASTDLLGIAIESRRAEEHVRHLALNDELTGLPNRLSFSQQLQRSIAKAERGGVVAVMFLDLDRFKYINDHFGHDAGDEVLRVVASGFRSCLREHDVLARIGGDEFMLLVDQFDDPRQLTEVAQRLLEEASRPFELGGQRCHLGVSIGIAVWPADGTDPVTLMKNADTAMYRAKAGGRNASQFFSPDMTTESLHRLALESGLRRAIDGREIVVHYQPKLDVATGELAGLEALVRWQHLEKGLILPAGFVPFAEEIGLISTIGMQVLQIACEDLQRMKREGIDCPRVAINLSVVQFNDEHLVDNIHEVIAMAGVDPTLLEIELTESMVMQNPQRAIRMMHGLHSLGITLSIDDFGTGYSSLASLKRLPVDRIKIDRSFVEDVTRDAQAAAIFEAIVTMTHTLGLKVVAEGVETSAQLDLLKKVGCDEYQGYFHSEPMPLGRLLDKIVSGRAGRKVARV